MWGGVFWDMKFFLTFRLGQLFLDGQKLVQEVFFPSQTQGPG